VDVVVTPRVREEVQRHFGCDKLTGAELEDQVTRSLLPPSPATFPPTPSLQGEEGTALTHWEKRLFENEAMTGTHTQNPIYSRITMALMEDTGWYLPNYALAEELAWGRGLGCDFALKSCKDWMETRQQKGLSIHPYCNKVTRPALHSMMTLHCTAQHYSGTAACCL
jgi:leishmanolysin-like peptidase